MVIMAGVTLRKRKFSGFYSTTSAESRVLGRLELLNPFAESLGRLMSVLMNQLDKNLSFFN